MKNCANPKCGNEFEPHIRMRMQKYCCRDCQEKHKSDRNKKDLHVKCNNCGSDFIREPGRCTLYCSDECKNHVNKMSHKKWSDNNKDHIKEKTRISNLKRKESIIHVIKKCKNDRCNVMFVNNRAKYCSTECRQRHAARTWANNHKELISTKRSAEYAINPDKVKKRVRDRYYSKHEIIAAKLAERYKNDEKYRENIKNRVRPYKKKQRDEITDTYVKELFSTKMDCKNPSTEQIEQKRITIKIKRLINEKQQQINTSGSNGRPI